MTSKFLLLSKIVRVGTVLLILYPSILFAESFTLGSVNIQFDLPPGYASLKNSNGLYRAFRTEKREGYGHFLLVFTLWDTAELRDMTAISSSQYIYNLLQQKRDPGISDYISLFKYSSGPVLFSMEKDHVYTGFNRFIVDEKWFCERFFSGNYENNKLFPPFVFGQSLFTSQGLLMIRLTFFAGPKVIEGLRAYGKVTEGHLELSSEADFEALYRNIQMMSENHSNELSTAYIDFRGITSNLKIYDKKYESWITDNSELVAEIKKTIRKE